jgi:hypothetical protein
LIEKDKKNEMLIVESVKLVYSLTAHASRYKLDIEKKIKFFKYKP